MAGRTGRALFGCWNSGIPTKPFTTVSLLTALADLLRTQPDGLPAYLADAQKLSQTGSWAWSLETGFKNWSEE